MLIVLPKGRLLKEIKKKVGNKKIIVELMNWADKISSLTRDEQKKFLEFLNFYNQLSF